MKQTTIQIYIEENICGATIFATSRRTKWSQYGETRTLPLPQEEEAWKLIAGENAQWGIGKIIEPKEGYAIKWSVTFYWDKPRETQHKDTHGVWTLKEYKGTSRRGKVIGRFDGILECLGDDLYWRLPDGDVPEGYDVFPDYNSVIVCQSIVEEKENPIWWGFEFKQKRKSA